MPRRSRQDILTELLKQAGDGLWIRDALRVWMPVQMLFSSWNKSLRLSERALIECIDMSLNCKYKLYR